MRLPFALIFLTATAALGGPEYFGVRVVDAQTGRGVPLVELRTVSHISYVTDSAGLVAFHEPGLLNRAVFFHVRSHGYESPRDGFDQPGLQLETAPGKIMEIKLQRRNIAERLYRLTGEGIYRDSVLLGQPVPIREPLLNAQVSGQDSAHAAIYRGKAHWFWGDTLRPKHPLGQYWMSGATALLPADGGLAPSIGVDFSYFTDAAGFSRPMWPRPKDGRPIWADGLVSVPDAQGRERLVAHFSHMKDFTLLAHGMSDFDDATQTFRNVAALPLTEKWRCLHGHPLRHRSGKGDWLYLPASIDEPSPLPAARVRAVYENVIDSAQYEAFTPIADGAVFAGAETTLLRGADTRPHWRWTTSAPPLAPSQERALLAAGIILPEDARLNPRDPRLELHGGSVAWNPFLRQWIAIAVQKGGASSHLGEVWFGVSPELTGPWLKWTKIVTHDRYSFYNPVHHPFLDEAGWRLIYFEGTYTTTFSGNTSPTPRYEYNQLLYRLDLADPRLGPVASDVP